MKMGKNWGDIFWKKNCRIKLKKLGGKTLWQKSTKHYLEIKIKNIKNIEAKKSYNKSIPRILDKKWWKQKISGAKFKETKSKQRKSLLW